MIIRLRRPTILAITIAITVTACANQPAPGAIVHVEGFTGLIAAEEPYAVRIARNVLLAGGNAADAAVALAFAMSVTHQASAGLGGGGACLITNQSTRTTETLEFLPVHSHLQVPLRGQPTAVPALPRGLFALHARYGHLQWASLLIPAETLVRDGYGISRVLAHALATAEGGLLSDPTTRSIFARPDGRMLQEGDRLIQRELAGVLARLRIRGPGDFYDGQGAHEIAEAVTAAGGTLSTEDLHEYLPRWTRTISVPFGHAIAHFAPPLSNGGAAVRMWTHLVGKEGLPASDWGSLAVAVAAPAGHASWQPEGTGFVIMDHKGMAIACSLTMNGLFGTKRMAAGMLLAVPTAGYDSHGMVPMLITKRNVPEVVLAGTVSKGTAAVLVSVAAQVVFGGQPLATSIAAPRVDIRPFREGVLAEQKKTPTPALGHSGKTAAEVLGWVNMAFCPDGLPPVPATCQVATDPRGHGLAVIVNNGPSLKRGPFQSK